MGVKVPDLVGALEIGLRQHNEEDTWGKDNIHMSDLAIILSDGDEKCARQVWHRLNGHARSSDSIGQMLLFDHGHRIHERLTQLLKGPLAAQGWKIVAEEKKVDDLLPEWMQGTLDILLEGPEGEKVVLDYKTAAGKNFRYLNAPKGSNVIQVQGYAMVEDADYSILFYVDREGSNTPVMFVVERDDALVIEAMKMAEELKDMTSPPQRMLPKVQISRNKGPDGIKLSLPWQCMYCGYLDRSCPGALKPELRDRIVGYKEGKSLEMKEEYEFLYNAVLMLLEESGKL